MAEFITFLFVLAILGGILVVANLAMRDRTFYILTIASILGLNGLLLLFSLSLPLLDTDEFENEVLSAVIFASTAALTIPLLFEPVRRAISGWFPSPTEKTKQPPEVVLPPLMSDGEIILAPQQESPMPVGPSPQPGRNELLGFDPRNPVHMVALVFSIYALGMQVGQFVLLGGLEGIADATEISYGSLLGQFVLLIGIALGGVGLFIRRSIPETLERLGLAAPTLESLVAGFVAAIFMLVTLSILVGIWIAIAGQETVEEQSEASQAISESIDTFGIALTVALTAAIGEELLFRGAFQPIFGLWWTAIIFVLFHTQYTLTPAVLILLVQAIVLGWLRRRYNLYAPIVAHFFYNFAQLLVALSQ